MGKPLRADAQRNRTRVLQAAQAAFAADGLAVPLDEIARRAGVGAGTVYRHFPSKEALFEAVILDRLRQLVDGAQALADADDPGEAFFGFLGRMVAGAADSRDLVDALSGTGMDAEGLIASAKRDLQLAGGRLLDRAQRAGAVREDIGAAEVMVLITAATHALRQHRADSPVRDRVFAVLRDGLRRQ